MKKLSLIIAVLLVFAFTSTAYAQITKDQYYARSTLSENELEYYDSAYEAIANQTSIYSSDYDISKERARQIIGFVYCDSPELFNGFETYSQEEVEELNPQLEQRAQDIISLIPSNATEYEKVKTVYFYLANHIKYSDEIDKGQNIVGGLLHGKAVCAGISRSLQYLLYKMDIPCIIAATDYHSWNMIQIDGEWYHADLTQEVQRYKHDENSVFLFDDSFIKGNVLSENNPPLPSCTSTKYMEPTPSPTIEPTVEPIPEPTIEPTVEKTPFTPFIILIAAVIAGIIITIKKRK